MDYYRQLIIKILDRSSLGSDDPILKKMKKGIDLNQEEMRYLEEMIDNIF